jgi:TonB family protein
LPPRIYGLEDAKVAPPVTVRESWAALADVFAVRAGVVEITIDETGAVAAATMTTGVNAVYDRLALATAKRWRYRPATLDGVPVKFRKVILLDPGSTR